MRLKRNVLVAALLSLAACSGSSDLSEGGSSEAEFQVNPNPTERATTSGRVSGFVGRFGALTWRGIPFATPPVGKLRWHSPLPPEPWTGVRDTVRFADFCPQHSNPTTPGAERIAGSEDCLYLNIYTPPNAEGRPVMVWIHGGGNTYGHAHTYDGSRLAISQNVIVVTINYRLGLLGWFSHPALATGDMRQDSGNFGTLDIIRALEWTRDNIAEFGGDPDNVTIFGESAGAFDVLALVVSPLAKGLFHRGISQSGGLELTPIEQGRRYREDGGHPYSSAEIVNALLIRDGTAVDQTSARVAQDAMDASALREYVYSKSPEELLSIFENRGGSLPVPDSFADGHVLPALPVDQILSDPNRYNAVPLILGTNRDEPSVFMFADPRHVEGTATGRRLRDQGAYLREVKYGALSWKERGVDRLAVQLTAGGNANVYAYRFDWDEEGEIDGFDYSKALGAGHAVELPFVFGDFTTGWVLEDIYSNSPDRHRLAESMMSYWTQFAMDGDPGTGRNGDLPHWLSWGTDGKTTLLLDTPSELGIRMTEVVVTAEGLKHSLANDPEIANRRERCARYAQMFLDGPRFDPLEFAKFGPDGCNGLDPRTVRGF